MATQLKFSPPIDTSEIPDFDSWVNWNDYRPPEHTGFDLAAYLTKSGICHVGLPDKTIVRAVTDGKIRRIQNQLDPYYETIHQTFDESGLGKKVDYTHVIPIVKEGELVERGQPIGHVYSGEPGWNTYKLAHLHLEVVDLMCSGRDGTGIEGIHQYNPLDFFTFLKGLPKAEPQDNRRDFKIDGRTVEIVSI